MTRVEMMNAIKELVNNAEVENKAELMEFCDKQIASFSKKSTSKADEKKAEENANIKATILEILADGRMRNSDITKRVNEIMNAEYQPQKISNLVKQMKTDGEVERVEEKGVAYFSLA